MMAEIDSRIEDMSANGVDVVIIGAGINGAGLFRDLCEQGVSCLIVDKADFGSGTSSAPSRLIHGGLKYLETGEFGLVAQSTLERNLLLKNAPHCVTPLPTLVPIFSWTKGIWAALRTMAGAKSAPRSRGVVLIKIGLALYDFYGSRNKVMPRHRMFSKAAALRDMPHLTSSIVAAGSYYDAKISTPERLVFELVKDGMTACERSAGLNYTTLMPIGAGELSFSRDNGGQFTVRPKIVINAAGPWIDVVNAALGNPAKLIGGTKGSHILLDHDELVQGLKGRMIYFEADDGRICLVYDYLGRALVGSTDMPASDPDIVVCEEWEIDYFLASLRALLPGLMFERSQIAYSYSGIRPLPASNASDPGLISRDHSAPVLEPSGDRPFPVISLVGGKWTTFRGFAEEVADKVFDRLGVRRSASTRTLAIGGGKGFPADAAAKQVWIANAAVKTGLEPSRIDELLGRYGTCALEVASHKGKWTDTDRLPDTMTVGLNEIDWIARQEMAARLSDIVKRRTTLALTENLTRADIEAIAAVASEAQGWTAERTGQEIQNLIAELSASHVRIE